MMALDLRDLELIPSAEIGKETDVGKKYHRIASVDIARSGNISLGGFSPDRLSARSSSARYFGACSCACGVVQYSTCGRPYGMIAIDLFCGAGGLTRGLLNAGINVLLGIDINTDCRATYELNNRPAQFLCDDLRTISAQTVKYYIKGHRREPLLLAGCAAAPAVHSRHQRSEQRNEESRGFSVRSMLA